MAIKFLNTATAATQAVGDNSTKIATTAYADAAASAIPIGDYLPLSAGASKPLTGGLHIPHYIYHAGNTGTVIGYPSVNRFVIGTNSVTRVDVTDAGLSLGDYQTNVSVSTILDEDDMASDSATALVTQQSIKAYVDAQTPGAGVFLPLAGGTMNTNAAITMSGSLTTSANVYAQRFYDQGNNSFYGDFEGTSQFNHVKINSVLGTRNFVSGSYGWQLEQSTTTADPVTFRFDNQKYRIYAGGGAGEIMTFLEGGNVGIGATSPGTKLHVGTGSGATVDTGYQMVIDSAGIAGLQILSATTQSGRIVFGDSGDNDIGMIKYDHTDNSMGFRTNGSGNERMRIDSAGNVGIGTSSPSTKLDLVGTATINSSVNSIGTIQSSTALNSTVLQLSSTYEEDLGQPAWSASNGSYTNNSVTAPNGTTTGTSMAFTTTSWDLYKQITGLGAADEGKTFKMTVWLKLGTATNFVMTPNNGAWNTLDSRSFDAEDGLNTTTWTQVTHEFVYTAGGRTYINFHIGANSGGAAQTAGTVFAWDWQFLEVSVNDIYTPNIKLDGITGNDSYLNAGNVGIGTTSPGYPLEISSDAVTSFAYQRTGVSANKWGFHSDNDATYWQNITSGNLLFTLQNGGNVGIGTTSPDSKLDVTGGNITINTLGTVFADFKYGAVSSEVSRGSITTDGIDLKINATADLLLLPTGDVGIGTTTPDKKLHVKDSAIVVSKFEGTNAGSLIDLVNSNASQTYNGLRFRQGTTSKMAITHIADGTTKGYVQIGNNWATGSEILVVDGRTSNVGIGTTSPDQKLHVKGGDIQTQDTTGLNGVLRIRATITGTPSTGGYPNVGAGDAVIEGGGTTQRQPGVITLMNGDSSISSGQDLGVIQFVGKDDSTNGYCTSQIISTTSSTMGTGASGGGILRFLTSSGNTGAAVEERMRINNSGRVMIGTTTSTSNANLTVKESLAIQSGSSTVLSISTGYGSSFINTGTSGGTVRFGAPTSYTTNVYVQGTIEAVSSVQMGNNSAAASAANAGSTRYRVSGNNSYMDMSMRTGSTTYAWVNIVQNNW